MGRILVQNYSFFGQKWPIFNKKMVSIIVVNDFEFFDQYYSGHLKRKITKKLTMVYTFIHILRFFLRFRKKT